MPVVAGVRSPPRHAPEPDVSGERLAAYPQAVWRCGNLVGATSRAGELLDAVIVRISDIDVPACVGPHAVGAVELPVGSAKSSPRAEEGAVRVELLDAVVLRIRDEDVPARIGRYPERRVELSI